MSTELPAIRRVPVADIGHAGRAAGLLAQARAEATEHIAEVLTAMGNVARGADQISTGGDCYPAGVRDEMHRLADHIEHAANRVALLMERARR